MKKGITANEFLNCAIYKKNIGDFCANYYGMYIQNLDKEVALENFMLLLKWNGTSEESLEMDVKYSKDDYQNTVNNILPMIKKILDNLVIKNLDEQAFYLKLWDEVYESVLFSSDLDRICSMIVLVLEPRIPYYKLGNALQMDNEHFLQISQNISTEISKAHYVLQFGYNQKTEIASQLYQIIDDLDSKEDKIVLIANILGYFNSRIKFLHDQLRSGNDKDEVDE